MGIAHVVSLRSVVSAAAPPAGGAVRVGKSLWEVLGTESRILPWSPKPAAAPGRKLRLLRSGTGRHRIPSARLTLPNQFPLCTIRVTSRERRNKRSCLVVLDKRLQSEWMT